jgi:DNA-binding NarL/FixJ family response regulator
MTAPRDVPIDQATKKIVVVDDHPMSREGIVAWILSEPGWEVSCQAETAEQALDSVIRTKPDVVVTDITLPEKSGLDLVRDIHAVAPEVRILVVSMHDERLYAERVLRAGGHGYVTKQAKGEAIVEAIRRILSGQVYVSRDLSQQILETFANKNSAAGICRVGQLTDREFEVFQLAGQGLPSAQIARRLQLSIKTVQAHRANIKVKLQIKTTPELISYAASWLAHQAVQRPA